MLPRTGPGTAASPILKDIAKTHNNKHKLRCKDWTTWQNAGGYLHANGCGLSRGIAKMAEAEPAP